MPLIFFLFSAFGLEDKVNCEALLLDFLSKFIDMYRMDTVISLILLLVSEMLKISWAIVEVHFFKKLAFPNNKFLAQDVFRKCSRTTENLSKCTAVRK